MLTDRQDAFGHEMYDYYHGQGGYEIIERDDGLFSISTGPALYFLDRDRWPEEERKAIEYARGRVLDIGCGAGRHALYLQGRGLDVVGIDPSPLATQVSRERGLRDARVLSLTQASRPRLGVFDTILMLGNNFCLVGNPKRAKWFLRRAHRMTTDAGRIIAGTRDPRLTEMPEHLDYHARNREQGKLSGQARVRVRYKKYVSPWIDFLMVSRAELAALLEGTGWEIGDVTDAGNGPYVAILEKVAIQS